MEEETEKNRITLETLGNLNNKCEELSGGSKVGHVQLRTNSPGNLQQSLP